MYTILVKDNEREVLVNRKEYELLVALKMLTPEQKKEVRKRIMKELSSSIKCQPSFQKQN